MLQKHTFSIADPIKRYILRIEPRTDGVYEVYAFNALVIELALVLANCALNFHEATIRRSCDDPGEKPGMGQLRVGYRICADIRGVRTYGDYIYEVSERALERKVRNQSNNRSFRPY